jgi:hypothetical protein
VKHSTKALLTVALAVAALAAGGTGVAAADTNNCPEGTACFWQNSDFEGNKVVLENDLGGTGWHGFTHSKFSMKNKFNDRAVYYATITGTYCTNPGPNDTDRFIAGGADAYKITGKGGRCWQ